MYRINRAATLKNASVLPKAIGWSTELNKYINDNGLKHPDNGRMIILDAKLVDLLAPPDGVQVTFLNIQKYLSPHYVKVVKEKEAPATPATPPAAAAASEAPKKKVVRKIKLGA